MKPKKSLGQNFFNNMNLAKKIVEIATQSKPKTVLEIGPGNGYFTALFNEKVDQIVAIEKDDELTDTLKGRFPKAKIVNSDFLDVQIDKLPLVSGETVCFGSLPYNTSKKIIEKLLTSNVRMEEYFFIIQKEVADKYQNSEKDTSILSIISKLYADCEVLFDISPGSFTPMPKVTSSLIKFTLNSNIEKINDEKAFIGLVKNAFSHPRKMLRNNLRNYSIKDPEILSQRPGDLSFDKFVDIANSLR